MSLSVLALARPVDVMWLRYTSWQRSGVTGFVESFTVDNQLLPIIR